MYGLRMDSASNRDIVNLSSLKLFSTVNAQRTRLIYTTKTDKIQRKLFQKLFIGQPPCDTCYELVVAEKLIDNKTYVDDYQALFNTICPGCDDLNRPLEQICLREFGVIKKTQHAA